MSKLIGLPILAFLFLERSDVEKAVELYDLSREYPFVRNSQWFEDVVGYSIADAVANLPTDSVTSAEKRGRNRNLDEPLAGILAELEREIMFV